MQERKNNIVIRTAVVDDAESLLDIYSYYVTDTAITFEYEVPSINEFAGRIMNKIEKYPYLVALSDDKVVGYAYAGPFKERAAYDWSVETTVYVDRTLRQRGIGRALYDELESVLKRQNILNMNACIASPKEDDEYLTKDSILFHKKMGFDYVGEFHDCGYKFNRWYNMVWMEKSIGEHFPNQPKIIHFCEIRNHLIY